MVPIRIKLCPQDRYSIKCPFTRTPAMIVVHNTGNCAPAENEVSYMINRPEEVSFHYAVDDMEAIQALPLNRNAWASGDGRGTGNMYGIHIEICYSQYYREKTSLSEKQVYDKFAVAERNAAQLIASLLKQYGWGIDRVTKHQDYDKKYCPHRTLDLGWQRFLNIVKSYIEEDNRSMEKVSGWAEKAVTYCKNNGIMNGDEDGNMRPRDNVTREELAAVVYNLEGGEKGPSEYAKNAWENAVAAGIFDGTNPRGTVTREMLAVILDKLGLIPEKS